MVTISTASAAAVPGLCLGVAFSSRDLVCGTKTVLPEKMNVIWLAHCLCSYISLMLLLSVQESSGQDSFYFHPHPQDKNVVKGRSVTLNCGVSNNRHITFYWTLNGDPVANSTRRYQEGSNLHITRVDPQHDLGEFKCIAMNVSTGISLASQGAQLNILWIGENAKVQLQIPEVENQLEEGSELSLRCKVDGSPEVRFEWFLNGIRIFRNERVSFRNKRLHIAGLTAADNGIYSCRAVNEVGAIDSAENFALILPSKTAAHIVQLPEDVTVRKNDSAVIHCLYENAAITEWYAQFKDVPLTNSSRTTIFPNGTLLINNVHSSDEGVYQCVGISAISKDAPQQTYVARLRLAYLQVFGENSFEPHVGPSQLTIIPRNHPFEVTCVRPEGHPRPRLWWEDPSSHVISDTGRIRVDDTRLIIDGMKKTDTGNYTCVAENVSGQQKNSIYLYVASPPVITLQPVSVLVDEGDVATLACEFSGSPYPVTTVRWMKNEKYVRETGTHFVVHQHNGTLLIKNVMLSDSGEYMCEVTTTGFAAVHSEKASLYVKERLKFVPPPVSKNLELGSNTRIYCKARGATKPVVRWIKEGQPFFEWPSHIQDENGTLHFNGVKNEDIGKYTCIATSSQGIINTTIHVDVIVMPMFTVEPSDTEAYEGYPVMLHCKAAGDPLPTIQWDKNNALNGFDQKRFHVMQNGTLYVSEAHMDDEGKYGCTAGNSGGFKRAEVSLIVKSAEYYSPNQVGRGNGDQNENTMTKTVTITLGAAAVYMILVMGLMIWCRFRRARRKARLLAEATAEVAKCDNDLHPETEMKDKNSINCLKESTTTKSDGELQSHSSGSHSHHSKRSRSSYDKLQFPRHDLQTMMLLGHGEYGEVFLAKARGIRENEGETVVMVKALQTREESIHFEFKREIDLYHKLTHENIAKLLGVCRDAEPFLMITEYSDWGDLKQFLLATRKDNPRKGPRPPPLSVSQILGICHQIALGMEFLSNHRFIHKDVATRNCLITSCLNIKISNPALSRDTYAQEYCCYRNKIIPLRWAPAEAVLEDEWSTKSDVWSFAVLVWEVFTQADLPLADMTDETILKLMKHQELRWSPLENIPHPINELLLNCWSQSLKERPSFSEIALRIGEIIVDSHV